MNVPLDLTGMKFGRLTALTRIPKIRRWVCKCDCGTVRDFNTSNLTSGISKSCGCLRDELAKERPKSHGLSHTPEYKVWEVMRGRCNWVNSKSYPDYGGRGISVCAEWNESFEAFIRDMGRRPSSKHSIERIDNAKNYDKENCIWATRKQQANNKRNNARYEFNGKSMTLSELSELSSIPSGTLWYRLASAKWPIEKAMSKPVRTVE